MKEKIMQAWSKIKKYFKPKEMHPLTADKAASLLWYQKEMTYEEMVSKFRAQIFKEIKERSLCNSYYLDILIPEWVSDTTYSEIIKELRLLGYFIAPMTNSKFKLLIIYWNK